MHKIKEDMWDLYWCISLTDQLTKYHVGPIFLPKNATFSGIGTTATVKITCTTNSTLITHKRAYLNLK